MKTALEFIQSLAERHRGRFFIEGARVRHRDYTDYQGSCACPLVVAALDSGIKAPDNYDWERFYPFLGLTLEVAADVVDVADKFLSRNYSKLKAAREALEALCS